MYIRKTPKTFGAQNINLNLLTKEGQDYLFFIFPEKSFKCPLDGANILETVILQRLANFPIKSDSVQVDIV